MKASVVASAQVKVNHTAIGINGHAMANAGTETKPAMSVPDLAMTYAGQKKLPPEGPTAAQLQDMVTQFISAYEIGDLERFDSLFSINAKSNDHTNLATIKQEYQELFAATVDRQLFINDLNWSFVENKAKGVGKMHALIVSKDDSVRVITGKIQFVAEKAGNKAIITHLYHYNLNVN